MNESIKYMAEVSAAAAEGAVIEIRDRDSTEWHTVSSLDCYRLWNWCKFDHRVKPEPNPPRKLVGLESDERPLLGAFLTLSQAFVSRPDESLEDGGTLRKIEFIELTPEIKSKLGL